MQRRKLILRREWFGGMFSDTGLNRVNFLTNVDYETKKRELEEIETQDTDIWIKIVDVTKHGYPLRRDALSSPSNAYLEVTNQCNGNCIHCYTNSSSKQLENELTLAEIKDICKRLSDVGADYIRITGGEPTTRSDLLEIIDAIMALGMVPAMNTNGRFSSKLLTDLLERGIFDFRISLDGPRTLNDAIRGHGSFDATMETMERMSAFKRRHNRQLNPTINVVLMQLNRDCARNMIEIAHRLDFKLSFGLLRPSGRASLKDMLQPSQVYNIVGEIHSTRRELGLSHKQVRTNFDVFCEHELNPSNAPFPFDNSRCRLASHGIGIMPNGRLVPCNYLGFLDSDEWLGEDVRNKDILELWHTSTVLNQARKAVRAGCKDCEFHVTKCNGGCPAAAFVVTGQIDGPDPSCIRAVASQS